MLPVLPVIELQFLSLPLPVPSWTGCATTRCCRPSRRPSSSSAPSSAACCSAGSPIGSAGSPRWWAAICSASCSAWRPRSATRSGRSRSVASCSASPSTTASWWCTFWVSGEGARALAVVNRCVPGVVGVVHGHGHVGMVMVMVGWLENRHAVFGIMCVQCGFATSWISTSVN